MPLLVCVTAHVCLRVLLGFGDGLSLTGLGFTEARLACQGALWGLPVSAHRDHK